MALSFVEAESPEWLGEAGAYARELGVPLVSDTERVASGAGVKLVVGACGARLGFVDARRGKPLELDFASRALCAHFEKPPAKSHIFRRALGEGTTLVDATAGFAKDAALARAIGFEVTAIERDPAVALVVRLALERARAGEGAAASGLRRLDLVRADARAYLAGAAHKIDVVYLDPMFDKPKGSAKSPKSMQILQELLSPAPDGGDALIDAALAVARRRVVVKRPLKARTARTPSFRLDGQSVRYDVYLVR